MSIVSVDGKRPSDDLRNERLAAGTVGGEFATPGSFNARTLNTVITPFDPRVSFGGTWSVYRGLEPDSYLGMGAVSSTPGSNITVTFTGTSITVFGKSTSGGGYMDVTLDGVSTRGKVNTYTTLALGTYGITGLNSSDTSVVLTSASALTAPGYIQIDGEVISFSGISTNTLTGCVRGASGTQAASHSSSAMVYGLNSLVNFYSPVVQQRIPVWSATNLSPGTHTLTLTLRSDHDASSSGFDCTIAGFVVNGVVGASNITTVLDYIGPRSVTFDASGVATALFSPSPLTTNQQIIGYIGCGAYTSGTTSGFTPCFMSIDPTAGATSIRFYCPTAPSTTKDVYISVLAIGASV